MLGAAALKVNGRHNCKKNYSGASFLVAVPWGTGCLALAGNSRKCCGAKLQLPSVFCLFVYTVAAFCLVLLFKFPRCFRWPCAKEYFCCFLVTLAFQRVFCCTLPLFVRTVHPLQSKQKLTSSTSQKKARSVLSDSQPICWLEQPCDRKPSAWGSKTKVVAAC